MTRTRSVDRSAASINGKPWISPVRARASNASAPRSDSSRLASRTRISLRPSSLCHRRARKAAAIFVKEVAAVQVTAPVPSKGEVEQERSYRANAPAAKQDELKAAQDAKDQQAAAFYEKYEFIRIEENGLQLFLPIQDCISLMET